MGYKTLRNIDTKSVFESRPELEPYSTALETLLTRLPDSRHISRNDRILGYYTNMPDFNTRDLARLIEDSLPTAQILEEGNEYAPFPVLLLEGDSGKVIIPTYFYHDTVRGMDLEIFQIAVENDSGIQYFNVSALERGKAEVTVSPMLDYATYLWWKLPIQRQLSPL